MAKRVNDGVELIKTSADTGRGGSRSKPPKAVAQRTSLEAPQPVSDHKKAKPCLTAKTVAFALRHGSASLDFVTSRHMGSPRGNAVL